MIVLIAIISMAAGQLTVDYGIRSEAPIPRQMLGMPVLPRIIASSSGLSQMFGWITTIENFYAIAIASIVYMIVIGGFASLLYAIAYRFVAPPRYGPQDIPAPKFKRTKYKR